MPYALIWLPAVLRAAGLNVSEVSGWETRGRAEMGTVRGVICHHTNGPAHGDMPTLQTLINGRSDLAGPLAQLGLGRDGTFHVVAAGLCNHAGRGQWRGVGTGNTSFIGVEAENVGDASDPWPDVQMDAYQRGVAAILKHIGAGPEWCCGHKEYALPAGRKDDPDFDMGAFRNRVSFLMGQTAENLDPAAASGRPLIRRGDRGDLVALIQKDLGGGLAADGDFGPDTQAAVIAFQRAHGLDPDGIVGPLTWALLDGIGADADPVDIEVPSGAGDAIDRITRIAAGSAIAGYAWKDRGRAPIGYIKGMAVMFGVAYCALRAGADYALDMVRPPIEDQLTDALSWYGDILRAAGMSPSTNAVDTLRALFTLLTGLGMRESGGGVDIGRDTTAANVTSDTAEAGLFQMSWNAHAASPLIAARFTYYRHTAAPSFLAVFSEGVHHSAGAMENFGTGTGEAYQQLAKTCPAFAVEAGAIGLRHLRKHWGPINRREAEVRSECDAMFRHVQAAIDADPAAFAALVPDTAPAPVPQPQPEPAPLPPHAPAPPVFPAPRKESPVTTVPVPAATSPIMRFEDEVVQAVETALVNAISARNPILGTLLRIVLDAGRKAFLPGATAPAAEPAPAAPAQHLLVPAAPVLPIADALGAGALPLPLAPVETALMDALKNFVTAKATVA